MKYFLAVTFTAESCSHWIGRLLTGQVFVFEFIYYESSSRTFEKLHVQKQFLVLLIWSSLLKGCFFSPYNIYLEKINSLFFFSAYNIYLKKMKSLIFFNTLSSCWNWMHCFLTNHLLIKFHVTKVIREMEATGTF